MNDLILRFEDTDIEIKDFNGERWIIIKEFAHALGLADHRSLLQMIDRNPLEFQGKHSVITVMTEAGPRQTRIINYHGVIRAAMLLCSAGQTKKDRIEPELPWKGSDIFRESRLS